MSPRGEKRAGGRPPKRENEKRQTLTCRVAPETRACLEELKHQSGQSIGDLIDDAVNVLRKTAFQPKPGAPHSLLGQPEMVEMGEHLGWSYTYLGWIYKMTQLSTGKWLAQCSDKQLPKGSPIECVESSLTAAQKAICARLLKVGLKPDTQ